MLSRGGSGRNIRRIFSAILIGLLVTLIVYFLSKGMFSEKAVKVKVVVAKNDILPWHRITAEDIELQEITTTGDVSHYYQSMSQVIGRAPVIKIPAGKRVIKSAFTMYPQELSFVLPEGTYGFIFPLNTSYLSLQAQNLIPGDRIDVLTEVKNTATGESMVVPIVQDVLVVAVKQGAVPDDMDTPPRTGSSGLRFSSNRQEPSTSQSMPRALILATTPEQAYALKLISNKDNISLLVKGHKTTIGSTSPTAKTLNQYLIDQGLMKKQDTQPPPPPKKKPQVNIIKGTNSQTVTLGE